MKFRIFDRKTKKYPLVEDFFINSNGCLVKATWIPYQGFDINECEEILFKKEPRYVVQFLTGLKDKNGVEIGEGDILRVDNKNVFGESHFLETEPVFFSKFAGFAAKTPNGSNAFIWYDEAQFEVIKK